MTWKEIRRAIERSALPLSAKFSQGIKASPDTVTSAPAGRPSVTARHPFKPGERSAQPPAAGHRGGSHGIETRPGTASMPGLRPSAGDPESDPSQGRAVQLIRQAEKDRRDGIPPHRAVNAIQIRSTESPHAHLESSPWGLALENLARRLLPPLRPKRLLVRSHIEARIPEVSAEALFPESWLDWAASRPAPARPFGHPVQQSRRLACDLGEGVGRDSTCVIVRDDWGILEIVCSATVGLPEAAQLIARLARQYGIPAERCSMIGSVFGRISIICSPAGLPGCVGYAGESSPQSGDFTNLRTEAAFMFRRLDLTWQPEAGRAVRPDFHIPPDRTGKGCGLN